MKGSKALFSSARQDWQTPPHVFKALHDLYDFDIDAAATKENAMLPSYWTEDDNALVQDWKGKRIWCNPPYNNAKAFIYKALQERDSADLITLLLPFRPDTIAFQALHNCTIFAFKGRLKFVGGLHCATFPSCLVFLGKDYKVKKLDLPGRYYIV
jgi:phage N-6-adenine-methyltransferase